MNALSLLVDGGLLSASMTACFYCIVLSRRVRRLASADQGVGKGVADMVKAVERLNASLSQTRAAARAESEVLQQHLEEARAISARTTAMLEEGNEAIGTLERKLADARKAAASLRSFVEASRAASQRPLHLDGGPDAAAAAAAFEEEAALLLLEGVVLDWEEDVADAADANDPLTDVMPIGAHTLNGSTHSTNGRADRD